MCSRIMQRYWQTPCGQTMNKLNYDDVSEEPSEKRNRFQNTNQMFVNTAAGSVMENNGSWIHQQHHQHQQQQLQNMPFDPTQPQPAAYAYFNDQTNPAEYPYGSAAPSFDPSIWYPNSQTTFFYDQPCDVIQNQFDYHHQQQNKQQQPIDDDPRCTRRRISANKKERRRTQSINNAFSQLRNCIPNVPRDTKLSKIKTLRLATKYIEYLMNRLQNPEPIDENTINAADAIDIACDFKADLGKSKKINSLTNKTTISLLKRPHDYDQRQTSSWSSTSPPPPHKKAKCRTGWPQEVWANELRPLKLERIDV